MSSRAALRPFTSAAWLALWGSLSSLASCGNGGDVYLGRAVIPASGTGGGSGGGPCGAEPCADRRGTRVFTDPSADGADAEAKFGEAVDGSDPEREPQIVYPSHETMFPINARNVRSEWQPGQSGEEASLFELEFSGPNTNTTVRVYTKTPSFVPNDEQWDWIAESNRGKKVTFNVRELNPAEPNTAFRAPPIELHFSAQAVEGAIYYWSTAGKGVMKALISDPNPVKFYPDPASAPAEAEKCVGCHSLSRDGKRLAVAIGAELRVTSVPERDVVLPASTGVGGAGGADPMKADKATPIKGSWSTFSPDGSRILLANSGKMTLLDATTGAAVGSAEAINVAEKYATHPDWSALGDRVALTLASKGDDKGGDKWVEGGSIAIAAFHDDTLDPPLEVIPSVAGAENNFFPVWSPDSRFLAYVSTTGKSQDSAPARVKLYDVENMRVIDLERLNERVSNVDLQLKQGNSMPTWAPSTGGGPFWLAFSSIREYASVRQQNKKSDQIWIAAIEPGLDGDPSYSAFWAPFQSTEHGNHRAFWTHTSGDRQCLCQDVCRDHLDNDCDGTADEDGCVDSCGPEICGNNVDDDCDCIVDDCSSEELCDDGVDNDGDGRADAADPSCVPP